MRAKFFWIILTVVSLVVVATTILHGEFLRREKIALIDRQVRDTATALLDSELGDLRIADFERVESILSKELGEDVIGKLFVIRNNAGQILFESAGVKLLPISEIPQSPRWITIEEDGEYIRILNLQLPTINDRTLQVGLIIGQELLAPDYFSEANLFFTAMIMMLALGVAWLLTSLLMRPISTLSKFVSVAARDPSQKFELPPLPNELKQIVSRSSPADELANLLSGFETLIDRVNRDYRMSRSWSYQMAHELKTPMALIEAQVTEAQRMGLIEDSVAKKILYEVFETSETITVFLTWAETENAIANKRLFVVRVSKAVSEIQNRLNQAFANRLEVNVAEDFKVMTNIQHFEQAMSNLLVNALNYSQQKPVSVEIQADQIRILDRGAGIPEDVIERLGEPFNKGEAGNFNRRSNGLGLALVQSICRLYKWKLAFQSSAHGTTVTITFPQIEISPNAMSTSAPSYGSVAYENYPV